MELIGAAPDVGAGAGDSVLAGGGVELGGAFEGGGADVDGAGEEADGGGLRLSEGGDSEKAGCEQRTRRGILYPGSGGRAYSGCRLRKGPFTQRDKGAGGSFLP